MKQDELGKLFYVIPDTSWLLRADIMESVWTQEDELENYFLEIPIPDIVPKRPHNFSPLDIPFAIHDFFTGEGIASIRRRVKLSPRWIILDEVVGEIVKLHGEETPVGTAHAKDVLRIIMNAFNFERYSGKNE